MMSQPTGRSMPKRQNIPVTFSGRCVTIACTDHRRSEEFYPHVLGAKLTPGDGHGCPWYQLGSLTISLLANAEHESPATFPDDAMPVLWLEVHDIRLAHEHLVSAGTPILQIDNTVSPRVRWAMVAAPVAASDFKRYPTKLIMSHITRTVAFILLCTLIGCGARSTGTSEGSTTPTDATTVELKAGGIYATKNENGKYTLTKILALDDVAVHARFYKEEFDEVPTSISSNDLTFLIGHAPMAREGFLAEHPDLVTIEPVSDSELEGYRLYLDAMRGQ